MQPIPHGLSNRDLRSLSDEELMMYVRVGQHDPLSILIDRYQRLVWSVAKRIVHDDGEAEDLVQTIFLELFQKVELFDPARGTLKVWLLQLAYTRSVNRLYHLQRRQFYQQADVEEEEAVHSTPVVSTLRLNAGESARLVREILETLNESQRTAIELIAFEGLTFDELAKRTGETLANAKHHYYRGMKKLRSCLIEPMGASEKVKPRQDEHWEDNDARAQSI